MEFQDNLICSVVTSPVSCKPDAPLHSLRNLDATTASIKPLTPALVSPEPRDPGNDALIHKLIESLEALSKTNVSTKTIDSTDSVALGDSSGQGPADQAPSSPTEVGHFDFSPTETISREHSTDCLVHAVQQLSLQGKTITSHGHPHLHNQPNITQHPMMSASWSNISLGTNPYAQPFLPIPTTTTTTTAASQQQQQVPAADFAHHLRTPSATPGHMAFQQQQDPIQYPTHYTGAGVNAINNNYPQQHVGGGHHHHHQIPPLHLLQNPAALAAAGLYQNLQLGPLGILDPRLRHVIQQQAYPEECLVGLAGQYQSYCDQVISEELNTVSFQLMTKVKVLQLADSPAVAHILGKRYFCSLKEVSKVVHCAKALIIAPDVRPSPTAHIKPVGLLQSVIRTAQMAGVPYVFALSRRGIGKVFGRDKNMSIVAIMQTDGVEADYVQMLELAARGRELYQMHLPGRRY